jgi:methylmalonyl-CoA epimerase
MRSTALAYVAIVSRDTARVAALFGDVLGLARTDVSAGEAHTVPLFSVGATAIALVAPGDSLVGGDTTAGVHHIAFAERDPPARAAQLAAAGIRVAGPAQTGIAGHMRIPLAPETLCGVRAYLSGSPGIESSPSGKVERIDHLGIACADNAAAIEVFCDKLGLALESQQTDMEVQIAVESFTSDKYGAVYHSRAPQILGGLRVAFVTAGDLELELLQNFDPAQGGFVQHGTAGTTRQDQGAIARYIATHGAGLHHIAFKVGDIDAVLAELDARGYQTIDPVGRPGSRRASIGFVHPRALGGVLIHLVQRD